MPSVTTIDFIMEKKTHLTLKILILVALQPYIKVLAITYTLQNPRWFLILLIFLLE